MQTAEERVVLQKRLYEMADALFEHADAVIILISITDDDKGQCVTHAMSAARGNHHTRMGLAYDYLEDTAVVSSNEPEDQ